MSNIIVMNNPYQDKEALDTVFYYCFNKCTDFYGFGVRLSSPQEAINSMKYIKKYWNQTDGKQLCHLVIGVDTNFGTGHEYTKYQTAKDSAYLDDFTMQVSYLIYQAGFQNCFFRHISRNGRPHAHYVINSVHITNGTKLRSHSELAYGIYDYLSKKYPDLRWTGVKYNQDLDESE